MKSFDTFKINLYKWLERFAAKREMHWSIKATEFNQKYMSMLDIDMSNDSPFEE